MTDRTETGGQTAMAILLQLQSEGLVRSFIDGQGNQEWVPTAVGETFQSLVDEYVSDPACAIAETFLSHQQEA